MSSETPAAFDIAVPQDALEVVKQRLATTTLPPSSPEGDDPWQYGTSLVNVARILEYWRTTYNWREHESALNRELPQFTLPVAVQDHGVLTAHFVHQKATRISQGKAIPLLFVHGWPGSFLEVRKILPLLTNYESDEDPVFNVVAPSLPGFGFSSAPEKPGFAIDQYAEACVLIDSPCCHAADSSL